MKTTLISLVFSILAVVLAQTGVQAQPAQAAPPVVNQQVNPANASSTAAGTAVQTLPNKNSSSTSPPVNPIAAAAYEKAGKATKSTSSLESTKKCSAECTVGDTCAKNC